MVVEIVLFVLQVGSGSSGSLVANRLSRHFKTLLLEAGGTPFPLQNVPAFAPVMIGHKDLDWRHYTVPQTYSCMSLTNRVCKLYIKLFVTTL